MFKCNHEACEFGPNGSKSFKLNRYLNYHLKNVHGKRENCCKQCKEKFALKWQLRQHEKDCGKSFKCSSCNISYDRWLTLVMHCRRKNHKLPENGRDKHFITKKISSNQPITKPVFFFIPVIENSMITTCSKRTIATDTDDLNKKTLSDVSFSFPKTQNTQTQTTLIAEYDSDDFLLRDQFLPSTFSSQSVQTDLPSSFQNSETQTNTNQSTQFDALSYWDMEFIDNQTQTVWNLDRHTQTDIENFISNF